MAWQARYRIVGAVAGAVVGVALRLFGVIGPTARAPGDAPWIGAGGLWAVAAFVGAYALLVFVAARVARGVRPTPRWLRNVVPLADLALLYGLVFLLGSPSHYERALALSVFIVLIAQLYFGTGPAIIAFRVAVCAYALLLVVAASAGAIIPWGDALLSLALYALGGGLVGMVHASRHRRLSSLAALFERLEEGDFTHSYDARLDPRPDSVTVVGRAYDRMRMQLATIVLTDPLSGCLNRRGFEQQLAREVARAERAHEWLALLTIDIDRFKEINDLHGHLAGDAVIREVGALLRETARAGDVVARVGGEEFTLVLPATDEVGAETAATRIVEAFRTQRFPDVDGRRVTASVGVVAERVRDLGVTEDLKGRADAALYAAKRGGRDRVTVWRAPARAAESA